MVTKLKKILNNVTNGTGLRGKGNILVITNPDNRWPMSCSIEEQEKISAIYVQGYHPFKEV